jgi:IclR family pca regulon transcriptional regulator
MPIAKTKSARARIKSDRSEESEGARDILMVGSVEKAFRVLSAFDEHHRTLSLTELADVIDLDRSATQRFAHTLTKLGYLRKDAASKRFELTAKLLTFGSHYVRASALVERAMPYLMHLSKQTEETVNLTVLDGTEIVFVARFLSRHVLNNDVVVGTRLPAYCTAPGVALLSRLPREEALDILNRSELRAYTPHTTRSVSALVAKIKSAAAAGFAVQFEEYFHGDMSIAAPVLDSAGRPVGAVNLAVSTSRYSPADLEKRFASLVVATGHSMSAHVGEPTVQSSRHRPKQRV